MMNSQVSDAGRISSLIPALARTHRKAAGSLLRSAGLAPGQELTMMLLWESEPRAQREITRELAVEAPTVTKMLGRLEQAGFVTRTPSTEDRRSVMVHLTPAGRALEGAVTAIWGELEKMTTAALRPEEVEELERLLRKVIGRLINDAEREI